MALPVKQIFVSYRSADRAVVNEIVALLQTLFPNKVWQDVLKLVPGDKWDAELGKALDASSHTLFCLGACNELGPWQTGEGWSALLRTLGDPANRRFIPVRLPGGPLPEPDMLQGRVADYHCLDLHSAERDQWADLLRDCIEQRQSGTASFSGNPYRGVSVFEREHAPVFFGRSADVQRVQEKLRRSVQDKAAQRLAIVGPSGVGKSSLVRAGLLPALAQTACPCLSAESVVFKPGDRPLNALAQALKDHPVLKELPAFREHWVGDWVERMRANPETLWNELGAARGALGGKPLLLVIDQFEEAIQALAQGEGKHLEDHLAFFDNLLSASLHGGPAWVVMTMRAEFAGNDFGHPSQMSLCLQQYLLRSLGIEGAYQAIAGPARAAGHEPDAALVASLLAQLQGGAGALSLLQEELHYLWEQGEGQLDPSALRPLGSALSERADRVLERVIADDNCFEPGLSLELRRKNLRAVFLALVNTEQRPFTSRRTAIEGLPASTELIGALVNERLLLSGSRKLAEHENEATAELVHENLIEHWQTLQQWVQTSDADDRRLKQFERRAEGWNRAHSSDKGQQIISEGWRRQRRQLKPLRAGFSPTAVGFYRACQGVWRRRLVGYCATLLAAVLGGVLLFAQGRVQVYVAAIEAESHKPLSIGWHYRVIESRDANKTLCHGWRCRFLSTRGEDVRVVVEHPDYYSAASSIFQIVETGETSQEIALVSRSSDGPLVPDTVAIPAGEFLMGSPESDGDAEDDEKPQHRVRITTAFRMTGTEITQAQYRAFALEMKRKLWNETPVAGDLKSLKKAAWPSAAIAAVLPVSGVSWCDAMAYADWLSDKTGQYWRLPTEAEWEYAARADSSTRYSWGDELQPELAVCFDCDVRGGAAPVGSFAANGFGLHDMHGNMREWVLDGQREYAKAVQVNPLGSASEEERVLRGGGWFISGRVVRAARRDARFPNYADDNVGFRLSQVPVENRSATARYTEVCEGG